MSCERETEMVAFHAQIISEFMSWVRHQNRMVDLQADGVDIEAMVADCYGVDPRPVKKLIKDQQAVSLCPSCLGTMAVHVGGCTGTG